MTPLTVFSEPVNVNVKINFSIMRKLIFKNKKVSRDQLISLK